ncbi:hypothetical protein A2619_05765 [candidate division WWE3 bacterium RIFOXYD1_FULL_39_9]|uniref:Uncharacterized protein n=1 Tax=candidate division WWE3 bacterium RIFOXYD1_FULL_39_9 TaxID=1802649 RepID=A0A1F4X3K8_UNCKA|nr:MAG: hypothetical protein A2619_05765 [candidate division WWE3 bacterium RIFOXYD1_FULL_39_9]
MADTQRTRAAILALFADNVTGQISAQDLRDFVVTLMNSEFAYEGDFRSQPATAQLTAEGGRGWKIYSQVVDSNISFGNILYMTISGTWKNADVISNPKNCLLAAAMSNITSGDSGILLRRGLIFKSAYSGIFSGFLGQPVYLASVAGGSISVTITTSVKIIGVVENEANGIYRFEPDWSVVGS